MNDKRLIKVRSPRRCTVQAQTRAGNTQVSTGYLEVFHDGSIRWKGHTNACLSRSVVVFWRRTDDSADVHKENCIFEILFCFFYSWPTWGKPSNSQGFSCLPWCPILQENITGLCSVELKWIHIFCVNNTIQNTYPTLNLFDLEAHFFYIYILIRTLYRPNWTYW